MRFSEHYGYKPIRESLQIDCIDKALRNGLWTLLKIRYWDSCARSADHYRQEFKLTHHRNLKLKHLCDSLWRNHFKIPLDELGASWYEVKKELRSYFFSCEWYEVYDFIEFVVNNYPDPEEAIVADFTSECNELLEREMSAYRFLDMHIRRITDEEEIQAVELAIKASSTPVRQHFQRALTLLSSRNNPDYRNSIKESISAVESLVSEVTGSEKGTLGQLLKEVESPVEIHPALKGAFSKLYGYTNDKGGIRHALTEEDSNDFDDAKFMVVACSAFVNYVQGKLSKTT